MPFASGAPVTKCVVRMRIGMGMIIGKGYWLSEFGFEFESTFLIVSFGIQE